MHTGEPEVMVPGSYQLQIEPGGLGGGGGGGDGNTQLSELGRPGTARTDT